jgi:cytochrome c-type biogenesis protein CcmH/NrfG
VVIAVYNVGGGGGESGPGGAGEAAEPALSPDQEARAVRLMSKLDRDPEDVASLVALGDVYFNAGDYGTAGGWMEQAVALDPDNVKAHLALGAAMFNLGDDDAARRQWSRVIALDPENVEARYDLGFLYLSSEPPQTAKAKQLWRKVVDLAPPGSQAARTVKTHLKALESNAGKAEAPAAGSEG